ncbi:MAG TPA: trigger factor [Solirubrobacteraceae bacterium]|jgi:trigger factor|nr:trigger factor [Solirubrobacteraceae bacterium]
MAETLTTTVTELPESRVRLQIQVPASELESRVAHKARELGRSLKLPGFRRGKVPAPLVIQRIGREYVLEEAVRETLGSWYADALESTRIVPVGDPDVDLGELPPQGSALEFSIEIGVLPKAVLGEYKGLEVGRAEPSVKEEEVDREVEGLRERLAKLTTVERAAAVGDFLVVDYLGSSEGVPFEGGEARDRLIELGGGRLIPGFEQGLVGAVAGERRTLEVTFPEDYPSEPLAGSPASFEVSVKEVKEKVLPEIDEDLAIDSGFDTLQELREDLRGRLRAAHEERVQSEFRDAALDAAVANAQVETPEALVKARAQEMWERLLHSLSHRGISRETYLSIAGRGEGEILAEMVPEAEQALRREAVITAVVEAEGIAPDEEALLEALRPTAEREHSEPEGLLQRLRDNGRLEELREDLAAREAIELIAAQAKPIPLEQAQAREKIWTPEKERQDAGEDAPARLWTPER